MWSLALIRTPATFSYENVAEVHEDPEEDPEDDHEDPDEDSDDDPSYDFGTHYAY